MLCVGYWLCVVCIGSLVSCDWLWCYCEVQGRGETLMHAAASRGHAEVVRLLIEAGADKNQATVCTLDGWAPRRVRLSVL